MPTDDILILRLLSKLDEKSGYSSLINGFQYNLMIIGKWLTNVWATL